MSRFHVLPIPTIVVESLTNGGKVRINRSDFNPKLHRKIEEVSAPTTTDAEDEVAVDTGPVRPVKKKKSKRRKTRNRVQIDE